jgi:single-stranded-DNA-specific exonuclease
MQFPQRSLLGKAWRIRAVEDEAAEQLARNTGIDAVLARFLLARGVHANDVPLFLSPSLKNQLPDPAGLQGTDQAITRIVKAIHEKQHIVIFGDYDVDGATATAIMVRFLRMVGADAQIYIPDRIAEGYGPNTNAFLKLREQGAELVITVDCGTVSFEPILEAKKAGLEVIVVDHHLAIETLPEAISIINPNRLDDTFPEKGLCAAGVCFLLCVAVNRALGTKADLLSLLDLVALGTVCDVMPLTGLNRAYVAQGLKVMAQKKNLGLATLMEVAKIAEAPTAYHLGFILGPRINAGGRIGKSDLGARLLTTNDKVEALKIAQELDRLNAERRTIETLVLEETLGQVERQQNAPVIIVSGAGWHPGVIGVVAGRLKEKTGKPVAVIGFENGIGKASARSITGVDLGGAITQARQEGLLIAGGGHAMAAGFTVAENKLPALTQFLCDRLEASVAHATANPLLWLDAAIGIGGINTSLVHQLAQAAPYGNGHSEPVFILPDVQIAQAKEVGQGHISCRIAQSGFKLQETWLKAVAFRAFGTPLEQLLNARQQSFHLAGKLKINSWNNRETVEFHIEDAMLTA